MKYKAIRTQICKLIMSKKLTLVIYVISPQFVKTYKNFILYLKPLALNLASLHRHLQFNLNVNLLKNLVTAQVVRKVMQATACQNLFIL